jgi:phosphoribosylformylglycinamidine cyclo-ligase
VRDAATQSNSPSTIAATAETAVSPPKSVPGSPLSYRDAGVDIDAGDRLVEAIKPFAKRTLRPEVLAGIGGFGALIELPKRYREPVLVAGTDGVGTKLKLAFEMNKHDTIGIDLVAMSVNDILVQGAEPLFFLDYFVCETLDVAIAGEVIGGIARGCEQAGCALAGGETAEHPKAFVAGEYDLAGFAVGVVEKSRVIDGRKMRAGDVLIGLASSGPHSNGFSLIRRILERAQPDLAQKIAGVTGQRTLGETLLEPTRIYVKPVLALLADVEVRAMAHITGGGLSENTHRMFPEQLAARIDARSWPRPPVFDWLQRQGNVDAGEMYRVFNCGIGFVLVVAPEAAKTVIERLVTAGERAYAIGTVLPRAPGEPGTVVS